MNNINCEHCGSLIDTDKEAKCPNCGAPYKNNKQYKEYLEYQKRQREINLETQKIANDITKDVHNTSKKVIPGVFIFVLIIMIISFVSFFLILFNFTNQFEDEPFDFIDLNDVYSNDYYDDYNKKEKITVSFDEWAVTDTFEMEVDKITKYIEKNYLRNNEVYYGFHVVFNNKTDSWKVLNDISLSYINSEGLKVNISKSLVSTNELDFFAKEKSAYEGYIYYDIDNNIRDVIISFENVDIVINDFREFIK